jgi:transposase InsO family protein
MNIHAQARTTQLIRAEIKASPLSERKLAEKYNITRSTVRKWKNREGQNDLSHRPHNMQTTLSSEQEAVVIEIRKSLFLPLDDLVAITREFIHPDVSRSGIARCLKRHGLSNLKQMLREQAEAEGSPKLATKGFKDYEPGFVHVDVKYLPQMADESSRTYLFVAIDRATRWIYLERFLDKSASSAERFLRDTVKAAPFKITKLLTDNGKEFTDRFIPNGEREPTGNHLFDRECNAHGIEHRLIKPKHPQTNGMVERFNGRISSILKTTRFNSADHLNQTLINYMKVYNYSIPQKALGHITPIAALKRWQKESPQLFNKKVYDLTEPDI